MRISWGGAAVALAVCVVAGCGTKYPDVMPATGTVTFNGNPVENAKVMFHPVAGGRGRATERPTHPVSSSLSTFGMNDGAACSENTKSRSQRLRCRKKPLRSMSRR